MDEDMINRASGVPPWRQLLAVLTDRIEDGTLPGKALPGERHLAEQYGISQLSVRKALAALREAGWVETTPGYGSRVLTPAEREERKHARGKAADT
jgi:DNA-binding GntR family transcriptional regulator